MLTLIAGGPGAGKSTRARAIAAEKHGARIRSTDELAKLPWQQQAREVAKWIRSDSAQSHTLEIIEGVRVLSGLKLVLERMGAPYELQHIDRVVFMHGARRELDSRARALAKRIAEQWRGLRERLRLSGVAVEESSDSRGVRIC